MMDVENMQEWGASGWVEMETIRASVEAYGRGLIASGGARRGIRGTDPQSPGDHRYTRLTVAEFLGWTREHNQPVVAGPASGAVPEPGPGPAAVGAVVRNPGRGGGGWRTRRRPRAPMSRPAGWGGRRRRGREAPERPPSVPPGVVHVPGPHFFGAYRPRDPELSSESTSDASLQTAPVSSDRSAPARGRNG
jgi:hypothetical protein